ncbi:uncharacterized protein LOC142340364 [Convolutriloba macropyga]|uniref:uncharacterized protein LOC142340364 n=1 Tax=Convolutriloba macropyga TaxID=536237 RepID=UPI003F51CA12
MINLRLSSKETDESFRLADEPEIVQACFLGDADKVRSILYKQKDDINILDSKKRSPLHAAAFNAESEIVNLLLLSGAKPNLKDSRWLTPLHRACRSRSSETVKALLEHSGDVVARDKNWQTPLHIAAANNSIGCAELLIPHLPNINVADRPGKTPLHHAAINGHSEMVSLLLTKNANVNSSDRTDRRPLHWAALMGYPEVVKTLLSNGAETTFKDKKGNQAIHFAASSGHCGVLLLLIEAGCDVNVSNVMGDTPLHLACVNHHTQAVNELLMNNADPHSTNARGYTCLHYISPFEGSSDIITKLILEECEVNKPARNGQTALHLSALAGRLDHCEILIRNGAWLECEDQDGNRALHLAAYAGHSEIVSLLIESGAKYRSCGQNGMSAMHMAASTGRVDCCKLLLSKALIDTRMDFEIDMEDGEGRTCLHLAALSGNEKCVELLIKAGSDLNAVDSGGRSALHYASNLPSLLAVTALLQSGASVNATDKKQGTPLHYASLSDHTGSTVECVLQNGATVSVFDEQGFTPIHYATMKGQIPSLRLLLEKTPERLMYKLDQDNYISPLHLAAYHGHDEVLSMLLECSDKNVNVRDPDGRTPLSLASLRGHLSCVETLLIQGNATVLTYDNVSDKTPYHAAASHGHANVLRVLIKNAESPSDVDCIDRLGRTPLMYVTAQGHLECLNILLNSAANVNMVDHRHNTALHRAVLYEVITAKIKHFDAIICVDINYRSHTLLMYFGLLCLEDLMLDSDGFSPMHWAAFNGFESCLDVLMQTDVSSSSSLSSMATSLTYSKDPQHSAELALKRANLISQYFTQGSMSPLHCAASQENVSCTEMLIEKFGQSTMLLKDAKGRLPIHAAAFNDSYESLMKFLCSFEEPQQLELMVNCKDMCGNSPLMLAALAGKANAIQLLTEVEYCDLDVRNEDGDTALHLACAQGHATCAELLLPVSPQDDNNLHSSSSTVDYSAVDMHEFKVARLFIQNNVGETALHLAARRSLVTVVQRLIKLGASLLVLDKSGYSPALACCPTQESANCLQLILEAMLPGSTTGGATGAVDLTTTTGSVDAGSDDEDGCLDSGSQTGTMMVYSDTENSIDSETF